MPVPAPRPVRSAATKFGVLVVDADESVHEQFRDAIGRALAPTEAGPETDTFGRLDLDEALPPPLYALTHAYNGEEALEFLRAGTLGGTHFALAFVAFDPADTDEGVETARKVWVVDPAVQIVLCTSATDFSWQSTIERTGRGEGLHLLRKPIERREIVTVAETLARKWLRQRARVAPWALSG